MYNPYIPQCYQNFILCQEQCDNLRPSSGFYIENLTGISAQMIANSANSNDSTAKDNLQSRVFAAIQKAKAIINSYITGAGFLFRSSGNMQSFCSFSNLYHSPIGSAKKGLVITKTSRAALYNSFFVDSLSVLSNTTGTHTIELIDSNNTVLQSLSVDLTAGQKTKIPVKWNLAICAGQSYYIVWANPNATPALGNCNCDTAGCCGNTFSYNDSQSIWYKVSGWDGENCQSGAYGISINAQVKCELDNLMCDILPQIAYSILRLTGAELAVAALSPQRTNSTNVNGAEFYDNMRQIWQQEAEIEIKDIAAQKVQQWAEQDNFCIYRNGLNKPKMMPLFSPFTAKRDLHAAQMVAIENIRQSYAKPLIDEYNDLKIRYNGIYGIMPMYWGFNIII